MLLISIPCLPEKKVHVVYTIFDLTSSAIARGSVIGVICLSLHLSSRPLILSVLEILSVSCNYSEMAAKSVVEGMHKLAITRYEPSFACLKRIVFSHDVEVKTCVVRFLNNLLAGFSDSHQVSKKIKLI